MKIIFTRHAVNKFNNLKKIGINIPRRKVTLTINKPEHLDKKSDAPKIIASSPLDNKHVLRVVYKHENDIITVITFYPTKKGRYYEKNPGKN